MRHPRLLIGLLVLATVLVDLVVWTVAQGDSWPAAPKHPLHFAVLILVLAQLSLAAVWVGYGGKWMPWTALLLVITILGSLALLAAITPSAGLLAIYSAILVLQSAIILSLLGLARMAGARLMHVAERAPSLRRIQFSLGYMFSWLTAVAVALGLSSYAINFGEFRSAFLEYRRDIVAVSVGDTAIASAVLWMMLGTRWVLPRAVAACFVTAATIAVWARLSMGSVADIAPIAIGQFLWLSASLAAVRVAGYRLVWRRAGGTEPDACP